MRRGGRGDNVKPRSVRRSRATQPRPESAAPARDGESLASIDIRVPVVFRFLYWGNTVVAIPLVAYFVADAGLNDSTFVFLLFGVFFAAQFARFGALRLRSDGEVLVVRNPWRTYRLHANEIQRFVVVRKRFDGSLRMLVIICELKRGGSIDLWATRTAGLRRYEAASDPLALAIEDLLAWKRSVAHEAPDRPERDSQPRGVREG